MLSSLTYNNSENSDLLCLIFEFMPLCSIRSLRLANWKFLKLASRNVRFSNIIITPITSVIHTRGISLVSNHIETMKINLVQIVDLSKFRNLRWIDIRYVDHSDNSKIKYSDLVFPEKVRDISLMLRSELSYHRIRKLFHPGYPLNCLKTVHISYEHLENSDIECMKMAEEVDLFQCIKVSDLKPLKNCKKLNIYDCPRITNDSFDDIQFNNIKDLGYYIHPCINKITPKKFINCEILNISNISDDNISGMKLNNLTCCNSKITDLRSFKTLTYLNCRDCVELHDIPIENLEYLNCSGTTMRDFTNATKLKKIIISASVRKYFKIPTGVEVVEYTF